MFCDRKSIGFKLFPFYTWHYYRFVKFIMGKFGVRYSVYKI